MKNKIEIYVSKSKMFKLLLFSLIFFLLGRNCLKSEILIIDIIGIGNIILSILCLIVGFLNIIKFKPQIILNDLGIIDYRILKEFIPWNYIREAEFIEDKKQKRLLLSISNDFALKNFKFLYKKTTKLDLNSDPKRIKIDLSQCEVDYNKLIFFLNNKNLFQ